MSKKTVSLVTATLVSAFKRKDLKEIGALILESEGKTKEAQEIRDAGRFTVALIDRTLVATETEEDSKASEEAIGDGSEGVDLEQDTKDYQKDKLTKGDIKDLVKKGDKKSLKKAKKALELQFDEDHPDYAGLAKLIKKAKKLLK